MVGALMQSTSFSSTVSVESKIHSKQYGNTKRSVKMMRSLKSPPMRVRTFSGLQGVNALGNMVNKGQHFHSKVAAATSARKAKPSRIVPKAMSKQEMYEHFTEKAMEVIALAQKEACQLGQNVVSTEMILLGLISEGTGIAAKVLKSMGINLEDARVEVDKIIGRASGSIVIENLFTACAERVLELSLEEARQLGHNYIGSEHLLLGLLREDEVVRACVFKYLGVDQNNIRTLVNITGKGSGIITVEIPWTFRAKLGFGDAMLEGFTRGHKYSGTDDIPFDLGRGRDGNALRVLENLGANPVNIRKEVMKMVDGSAEVVGAGVGGRSSGNNMLTLEEYDTNFTKLSDEGKLDPVIKWKPQIKRDTQIPVGLTETKPETIEANKVITLELRELEGRLKRLIKLSDEIILFIDEFRTLIGARAGEGDIDVA